MDFLIKIGAGIVLVVSMVFGNVAGLFSHEQKNIASQSSIISYFRNKDGSISNYFTEGNKVLYARPESAFFTAIATSTVEGADTATFSLIGDDIAKDTIHVYYQNKVVLGIANPPTFHFLARIGKGTLLYGDNSQVYSRLLSETQRGIFTPLQGVDVPTLRMIETKSMYEVDPVYFVDKNNFYCPTPTGLVIGKGISPNARVVSSDNTYDNGVPTAFSSGSTFYVVDGTKRFSADCKSLLAS